MVLPQTKYTLIHDSPCNASHRNLNYLELNVSKTKGIVFDFRKTKAVFEPIYINDTRVEMVDNFKYLGTTIDSNLNWKINTQKVAPKANHWDVFCQEA